MLRAKILEEFSILNCIESQEWLERYVDFCLEKNVGSKKLKQTSSHHILPAAKTLSFKQYSNLRENPWNKSELYYYDHYYAHFLLAKAINHISIYIAFCGMHKKDVQLDRLTESELIPADEFQHIWSSRNQLISDDRNSLVDHDGVLITKAKSIHLKVDWTNAKELASRRFSGSGNPTHRHGVVDKIRQKKTTTIINGKNMDTISAERAAETMRKEFILDGEVTTQYRENGKKLAQTLATSDLGKRRAAVKKERYYSSEDCPMVIVKNALDETYSEVMTLNAARKISPGIDKKTKADYLGKSAFGRNKFVREGKEDLIGLYAERLP